MRLRLHHRIVLPFAVVAFMTTSAVAWVALSVTHDTVTSHLRQDVVRAAAVVARSDFASNPAILSAFKQVTAADVVTLDGDAVVATTIDEAEQQELLARLLTALHAAPPATDTPAVQELDGTPSYYAAYASVLGQPDMTVVLLADSDPAATAAQTVQRGIVAAAAISLFLTVVVIGFVARRVTAPIERLGAFAHKVSQSPIRGRADTGDDEVGRLGAAFNAMLERLDQAQAALVASEKLSVAGLFAARVAHDVRNPLSSLKMQTQLLHAEMADGSEAREMTEAMLQDITQVEFVVKSLLDLARPGKMRYAPCRINDLLDGVIRQVGPQCRHRRITVRSDLADDIPTMSLDADRLAQGMLNVVVNAVEALREGGTLQISSRLDAAGNSAIIQVDDDGVGLDETAVSQLFDPFVTTKPGGVGLGLVNAKAAVESHGGTITLTPRTPAGTRATITLPVVAAAH